METFQTVFAWAWVNLETILVILGLAVTLLQNVRYGFAKSAALTALAAAIEQTDAEHVKHRVREMQELLPTAARDAIDDAVQRVDIEKPNPSVLLIFLREALRGIKTIRANTRLR